MQSLTAPGGSGSVAQGDYLSEDDVEGEDLKEEVRGDGQNLLLLLILLHDVAVGRVVKVQPAEITYGSTC